MIDLFKTGDLIIYSTHGVCRIDDISDMTVAGETKSYYTLHPINNAQKLQISIPVDSDKVMMLTLLEAKEAKEILESFRSPGVEWNPHPNNRNREFLNVVHSGNRHDIAQVINTLARRQSEAILLNKKLYEQDRKILENAKTILVKELSLALELSEEIINDRRIQECCQSFGEIRRQAVSFGVEIIQMIFKSHHRPRNFFRIINAGYDSATFLLCRETLYQNVNPGRYEQISRLFIANDGVWFTRFFLRPMHRTAVEMARINQWSGSIFGVVAKKRFRSEVHNPPGGN